MKKTFLSIFLMLAVSGWLMMWADSATPYPIKMRQPDGSTVTLRLHGDEFCSWYTSEDGRVYYRRGSDGWWRPDNGSGPNRVMRSQARSQREERDASMAPRKDGLGWGEKRFLVILVQWSDQTFKSGFEDYFHRALNENGFSDNGSVGSARDYYMDASQLQFQPVFDVIGPVTISRKHDKWPDGDNAKHYKMAQAMIKEAAAKVDNEVDFSIYDIDKDGLVDNVYLIYPGYSQSNGGGEDTIWPHANYISSTETYDGVRISRYACSSELYGNSGSVRSGIGTFCHEFGHVLGLPDLYDTDYEENGQAFHPSAWNLMANGNHNEDGRIPARMSLYERFILGYIKEAKDLDDSGEIHLNGLDNPELYRIPTPNEGEFFLPEVRDGKGFDKTLPAGLIIYHVDRSNNLVHGLTASQRWEDWKLINGYVDHPCHYLEIPDETLRPNGRYTMDGDYKNSFHSLWVFPKNSDWNVSYNVTDLDLKAWDGSQPYSIHGIKYANGEASFTMTRGGRTVTGVVFDAQTGEPLRGAVVLVEAESSSAPARVYPMRLSAARSSASYEAETDYDGQFLIELSEDFTEDMLLSVFATNYNPGHADLHGWSVRKDIKLEPVLQGGTDIGLTKANLPITYFYSVGGSSSNDYSVAQRFSAEELNEYVGGTISTISFSTKATGSEVWVFVDYGTKERVFARRVTNPISTAVYANKLSNDVDISDAQIKIPEGEDLYIGYLIKQSDVTKPVVSDESVDNPNRDGFLMYMGFSTTETPGDGGWKNPNLDWSWNTGNAMISCSLKSPYYLDPNVTLTNLGISYIDLPSGTLTSGQRLPLKLVTSPSEKITSTTWFYDGIPVESESIVLSAGNHILMVRLQYADGREDKVESQIVVQ